MSDVAELAELIPGKVYAREDAGLPAEPGGERQEPDGVEDVIVHWTTGRALGRPNTPGWVKSIWRYHVEDKGWADVGYNFLVDKFGNVFFGRGRWRVGAHARGSNTGSYGIAYLGGHAADITAEGKAAIRGLTDWLSRQSQVDLDGALGHRDVGDTDCPGDLLHEWVHDGMPWPSGVREPDEEDVMPDLVFYARRGTPDADAAKAAMSAMFGEVVATDNPELAQRYVEGGVPVVAVGGPAADDLDELDGVEAVVGEDAVETLYALAEAVHFGEIG